MLGAPDNGGLFGGAFFLLSQAAWSWQTRYGNGPSAVDRISSPLSSPLSSLFFCILWLCTPSGCIERLGAALFMYLCLLYPAARRQASHSHHLASRGAPPSPSKCATPLSLYYFIHLSIFYSFIPFASCHAPPPWSVRRLISTRPSAGWCLFFVGVDSAPFYPSPHPPHPPTSLHITT